jgi:hypothetical protein
LLGISVDEIRRVKDSDVRWIKDCYPLIDRRLRRSDCFHSDAEWRRMKLDAPAEFADAVAFERNVQERHTGLPGIPFLHATRLPLGRVDLSSREDRGQLSFDQECDGLCGTRGSSGGLTLRWPAPTSRRVPARDCRQALRGQPWSAFDERTQSFPPRGGGERITRADPASNVH